MPTALDSVRLSNCPTIAAKAPEFLDQLRLQLVRVAGDLALLERGGQVRNGRRLFEVASDLAYRELRGNKQAESCGGVVPSVDRPYLADQTTAAKAVYDRGGIGRIAATASRFPAGVIAIALRRPLAGQECAAVLASCSQNGHLVLRGRRYTTARSRRRGYPHCFLQSLLDKRRQRPRSDVEISTSGHQFARARGEGKDWIAQD